MPRASGALRWLFVALTVVIAMVGYADRQFLALLKPVLDREFGWTAADYGAMTTAFQAAIAVSLLGAGWFLDRIGLRWGFAAGLGGWSLAAALHAVARTVPQFVAARVALGVCEAVGTPAGMKALATFFRAEERNVVIGLTNAAPNLATMITPIVVTALYLAVGWQITVLLLGAVGFVCVALWLALPFDRMTVHADQAPASPGPLLRDRHVWAIAGAKLLTDQAWWFMLFYLPDYFHRRYGLDMRHLGAPVATVYAMAAAGSLLGGIAPARLGGRFRAMLVFALAALPIAALPSVTALWPAVLLAGLMLAAHQGFATNIFGLAADLFPASRVGAAIGFAAFWGNIGGAISAHVAGALPTLAPMFAAASLGYSLALILLVLTTAARGRTVPPPNPRPHP